MHFIFLLWLESFLLTSAFEQLQTDDGNNQNLAHYLTLSKHPDVFGIIPTNCSGHVPPSVLSSMEQYSKSRAQKAGGRKTLLIPDDFLVTCLLNVEYMPFWRALGYSDRLHLQLSFALEQMLRLDQDGSLRLKATLEMDWNEPHLQWNTTDVPPSIAVQCAHLTSSTLSYYAHLYRESIAFLRENSHLLVVSYAKQSGNRNKIPRGPAPNKYE